MWTDSIIIPLAVAAFGTLAACLASLWDARHGRSGVADVASDDPRRFFAPARADDEDARRRLEMCRYSEERTYALSDVDLRLRQHDL